MAHKVAVIADPRAFAYDFDLGNQSRDSNLAKLKQEVETKNAAVFEVRTFTGRVAEPKQHRWHSALSKPLAEAKKNGDTLSYVLIGSTIRHGLIEATDALQELLKEDTAGTIKSCSVIAQNGLTKFDQENCYKIEVPIKLNRCDLSRLSVPVDILRMKDFYKLPEKASALYEQEVKNLAVQELISIPKTNRGAQWALDRDFFQWLGNAISVNQKVA